MNAYFCPELHTEATNEQKKKESITPERKTGEFPEIMGAYEIESRR